MEARQVWHLSFMWTWMFFFLSVCSGMNSPTLRLESTVFVTFAGEELNLSCELMIPANQSSDVLTCSDPLHKQIFSYPISGTVQPQKVNLRLELKSLTSSGEYSCQYKTAKVYWYLRVRMNRDLNMPNNTEVIAVAVFTGVLLVFSVVGSVYVFRGHGTDCLTECCNRGRKQKQNREERKEEEMEEDNVDVITAQSTSFYASLQTRPRSIYDVLDHSAASREPDRSQAKPKGPKEPKETVAETTQDQHEGVFESVYENF
ncbi:NFAT activation molecule 1 [Cebidichthys violaceus]|uniref:NFAT activation molecule 1 n=1 Tax=Cebidichthys violaceus TaxID=271503 RepID=UPI0035C9DCFA